MAEQTGEDITQAHGKRPAVAEDGIHVHIKETRSIMAAQMLPHVLEGH